MKKGIIVLGSSNSKGNTQKICSYVSTLTDYPIIDLKQKNIAEFDYEFRNRNDDFHPLIQEIVDNYELIIFATPVYWYNMSGIMKTFFDRISDCLKIEKDTGRKLRGMHMAVISCGSDKNLKHGFYMPFTETAAYLGMNYLSDIHCWIENGSIPEVVQKELNDFSKSLIQ
ncbi:flavodoxin family protein [Flagellimonas flava]|uniref:NADPH-dependent FMN reductase n=1 Tax=Flagellimonas flava TaxID=570519 RepID=A0A1M5HUN0_9FLAO|nr:NAD(P)H-dependent oxidoreductase [Allomuricauda flava]SHG19595.1 NADPH-dependent FMN reductase [Allomuricauda flava]